MQKHEETKALKQYNACNNSSKKQKEHTGLPKQTQDKRTEKENTNKPETNVGTKATDSG